MPAGSLGLGFGISVPFDRHRLIAPSKLLLIFGQCSWREPPLFHEIINAGRRTVFLGPPLGTSLVHAFAGSLAGPARYFHRNWALPFSVGILFTIEMKSLSYPFGSDSNVFVPSAHFCQSLTTAVGDISSGGSFFLRRRSGDLHGYTRL